MRGRPVSSGRIRRAVRTAVLEGAILLLLLIGLAGPSCQTPPGEAAGTVTFRDKGLEGISVDVYLDEKTEAGGTPFSSSETGPDGRFLLTLPPGEYYLWAKESAAVLGPRKVGEYSSNPVRIRSGETLELEPILLLPVGVPQEELPLPGTGVQGRVLIGERPVEDAAVMVYDAATRRLMGPGYIALVRSDIDGLFEADLAPGAYQVAVRKRQGGEASGFLRPGDYNAVYPGNPITVREGEYENLGDLALHEVDRQKLAAEESTRFQEKSPTRLTGRVVGPDGKPLAGQFVFIYRDQGMIGRPDFLTTSEGDGGFVLSLPEGGTYYLGARNHFGGPRQPGEWVGRLAGAPDAAVEIETGQEISGLTIEMKEVW